MNPQQLEQLKNDGRVRKERIELLTLVLSQQSESYETKPFRRWLQNWIKQNVPLAKVEVNNGNLYVTKGKANPYYPCMVSHIDTVHDINMAVSVHRQDDYLFAWDAAKKKQYGIGGDDKVGVFVCLTALLELPDVKCAFFRDEEVGCEGSRLAVVSFFDDCAFALQCDRRGNKDFINDINGMDMYSKEFSAAIAPTLLHHGYKETDGMMTDVEKLKQVGVNLCMANMSCGYYEPHTSNEYVVITDVLNCLEMCMTICRNQHYKQWTHKGTRTYGFDYGYGGYKSKIYDRDWDAYWTYDGHLKRWVQKDMNTVRWAWKDVYWDDKQKSWMLPELKDVKKLSNHIINGSGKVSDPYRFAARDAEYAEAMKNKKSAEKQGCCPQCGENQKQWDGFQLDYYCMHCMLYFDEAKYLHDNADNKKASTTAAADSKGKEKKKASETDAIDKAFQEFLDNGSLPSTKLINDTIARMNERK